MKENIHENKLLLGLVLSCALPLTPALLTISIAQANPKNVPTRTPEPGSKERVAILNALRIPVTKMYKGKRATFYEVEPFRVGGGWAYLFCLPANSKGKGLGPRDSPHLSALLRLQNGKWRVMEYTHEGNVVQNKWLKKYPSVSYDVLGLEWDEGGDQ